jgi:hypothetical protein
MNEDDDGADFDSDLFVTSPDDTPSYPPARTDPRVLVRILEHIGIPSSPPSLDPPRLPSNLELDLEFD